MSKNPIFEFSGGQADVRWDQRLCIHMNECNKATGDLFDGARKPWCQPGLASVGEVKDVIERCPSGALSYRVKDGGTVETAPAENTIVVGYNGPLFVRGDLTIAGAAEDMPGVRFRAALCRCGRSANKPFCDNSHETTNFQDHGAVGESSDAPAAGSGGPLTMNAAKDGPFLLNGPVTIIASSGRPAWRGRKTALCRCGHSNNKPFCDGSHKTVGFRAD